MNLSTMASHQWLFGLGIVFVLSSIFALSSNKRQRDAILSRLQIHRRRASGASTPPRSFSPNKKISNGSSDTKSPSSPLPLTPDYVTTFPPSRRHVFRELAENATPPRKNILFGEDPSDRFLQDAILPITQSYDSQNDVPRYTPTGFSTADIKAMGDFPAYDILSGVPLPQPYTNFDPTKAVPRPYRPFRWAYHQTMCKFYTTLSRTFLTQHQH